MKRYQTRRDFIKSVGLAAAGFCLSGCGSGVFSSRWGKSTGKPNILFILADDFGYGDISCYNSEAKVATPNLDKLAGEGILLTDAHSASTVCTPTRYSLMTGRMEFRTGFPGVFTGAGGPCLIEESRLTLPGMLGKQGYETAGFGKWHIGLTFLDKDGKRIEESGIKFV